MTLPLAETVLPAVPRLALVSLSTIAIATAGLIASPPFEPAWTVVVTFWIWVALTVKSWPPVRIAPSITFAHVWFGVRTLIATEAPMPTLELPPSASASACAVAVMLFSARTETSPVPAETTAPLVTVASVWSMMMFSATEPATPMSSLPAPDFAVASKVCVLSPPTSVITESTCRPLPVSVVLLVEAWLRSST